MAARNMGARLLKTWAQIRPGGPTDSFDAACGTAFTLPVAFGIVCAAENIDAVTALNAYAYTRLAATCSAAMRLMPIGQHEAHRLLAEKLLRVPALVDAIVNRGGRPSVFAPALDIAAMAHQFVPSRLFRS
jgi:urease accessory protein UreF